MELHLTVAERDASRTSPAPHAVRQTFVNSVADNYLVDVTFATTGTFRRLSRSVGRAAAALITTGFGLTFASTEFDRGPEVSHLVSAHRSRTYPCSPASHHGDGDGGRRSLPTTDPSWPTAYGMTATIRQTMNPYRNRLARPTPLPAY